MKGTEGKGTTGDRGIGHGRWKSVD